MLAYPKTNNVRSTALMLAYRTLPCQHCGAEDGTVVAAHSNWSAHGKARSMKAGDQYCASLCFICHRELDQGSSMDEEDRKRMWHEAHVRTVQKLVILKRWPATVPVPDLSWPKEW
jgi:cytochrome c